MKINKILTLAAMAVTTLFATSCSDSSDNYSGPGEWDAADGFAQLYFEKLSTTESIDPADPTTAVITVSRHAKHETSYDEEGNVVSDKILTPLPALTAKTAILVNTDDVFNVSDAVFAEGEETGTINVSFPNAEIGKEYTLQVTFDDPTLVSQYSKDISFTYKVTRVKWNSIGKGKFTDDFIFGEGWEVEIMQREDDKSYYRVMDPYGPKAARLNGSQSSYVDLHIVPKGGQINGITINESGVVDWLFIRSGFVNPTYGVVMDARHPQNFTSASVNTAEIYAYNRVVDYLEDGKPGRIALAPYWYMSGVGGWDYTTEPTIFINLPGYVEEYTAAITDYDFEDVFTGEYVSEKLGSTNSGITLRKGKAIQAIEDANEGCYKRAEEAYGVPYMIVDPYGTGKNLYFYVKGDEINVPADMLLDADNEITMEYQPTGMNAVGDEVYAKINASKSSFSASEIVLNITFSTLPDEEGNAVVYGTTDEILQNIKWNKVGTGMYTYTYWFAEYDDENNPIPVTDGPLDIYQREDKPTYYKVTNWGNGAEFLFTWDGADAVTVPASFTGSVHSQYGSIYVSDLPSYDSSKYSYDKFPCTYDASTQTFSFIVAYWDATGIWDAAKETLKVTWDASASHKATSAKRSSKTKNVTLKNKTRKFKKNSRFGKGVKTNVKSKKAFTPEALVK